MNVAPKLANFMVNVTYSFKNHEIFFKHFDEETQTPWNHEFFCTCEDCVSYFGERTTVY